MKKSKEILGLAVISIDEGDEVGRVGHIIPNVITGAVAGLALERVAWYRQPEVIPFSLVVGMSQQALTIENQSSIYPLNEMGELEDMLSRGNEVIGLEVITKCGYRLGRVTEFLVDASGKIAQYLLEGEAKRIEAAQVLTIGKKLLVVMEEAHDATTHPVTIEDPDPPRVAAAPQGISKHTVTPERVNPVPAVLRPRPVPETLPADATEAEQLRRVVVQQQEESILGAKCGRTLMADSGSPIVRKGEEITTEIVVRAKQANRFSELVESTRLP